MRRVRVVDAVGAWCRPVPAARQGLRQRGAQAGVAGSARGPGQPRAGAGRRPFRPSGGAWAWAACLQEWRAEAAFGGCWPAASLRTRPSKRAKRARSASGIRQPRLGSVELAVQRWGLGRRQPGVAPRVGTLQAVAPAGHDAPWANRLAQQRAAAALGLGPAGHRLRTGRHHHRDGQRRVGPVERGLQHLTDRGLLANGGFGREGRSGQGCRPGGCEQLAACRHRPTRTPTWPERPGMV